MKSPVLKISSLWRPADPDWSDHKNARALDYTSSDFYDDDVYFTASLLFHGYRPDNLVIRTVDIDQPPQNRHIHIALYNPSHPKPPGGIESPSDYSKLSYSGTREEMVQYILKKYPTRKMLNFEGPIIDRSRLLFSDRFDNSESLPNKGMAEYDQMKLLLENIFNGYTWEFYKQSEIPKYKTVTAFLKAKLFEIAKPEYNLPGQDPFKKYSDLPTIAILIFLASQFDKN